MVRKYGCLVGLLLLLSLQGQGKESNVSNELHLKKLPIWQRRKVKELSPVSIAHTTREMAKRLDGTTTFVRCYITMPTVRENVRRRYRYLPGFDAMRDASYAEQLYLLERETDAHEEHERLEKLLRGYGEYVDSEAECAAPGCVVIAIGACCTIYCSLLVLCCLYFASA